MSGKLRVGIAQDGVCQWQKIESLEKVLKLASPESKKKIFEMKKNLQKFEDF